MHTNADVTAAISWAERYGPGYGVAGNHALVLAAEVKRQRKLLEECEAGLEMIEQRMTEHTKTLEAAAQRLEQTGR